MIRYNPKNWFSLIFQFHKSDTFRILVPTMIILGVYTAALTYIDEKYLDLTPQNVTTVHSMLGVVMGLVLVFRTNTAYERWWEGRKLWGSMVNDSRNLALKLSAFLPENAILIRQEFVNLIGNYVKSMGEHLRSHRHIDLLEPMTSLPMSVLQHSHHIPNTIARAMFQQINVLYKENTISGEQLLLIEKEAKSYTDSIGACERIKSTPIPYAYSLFMKKFIFLYVMTLPMGFIPSFGYWTIAVVIFVFYVLVSLELIAEEVEDPFGMDANDLPTEEIAKKIKRDVTEILTKDTQTYHIREAQI
jgi:putative membrane protein